MKSELLPTFEDLSEEQDAIYRLPLDRPSLVTGPPGSGKTVLALYRSQRLRGAEMEHRVITHSKVLRMYIEAAAKELDVDAFVSTFHSFVHAWWKSREGGAGRPPQVRPYEFDWDAILETLGDLPDAGDLEHLIVDEAQDLPNKFFLIWRWIASAYTVFADENQRITEENSTIEQIMSRLGIDEDAMHALTRNYRNTKQIHDLAVAIDPKLGSEAAARPERSGSLPRMVRFDGEDAEADHIARLASVPSNRTVGVFVPRKKVSRRIIQQLSTRLANKGRPVQAYMSGVDEHSTLDWSLPGVYVLMYPSTKGLQFDHVCIPRLETADGAADEDLARMRFYVMATRARSGLTVSWNGREGSSPPAVASVFDRSLMEVEE